jgi:hypothetical protein
MTTWHLKIDHDQFFQFIPVLLYIIFIIQHEIIS